LRLGTRGTAAPSLYEAEFFWFFFSKKNGLLAMALRSSVRRNHVSISNPVGISAVADLLESDIPPAAVLSLCFGEQL